jgi:hypothetical protein
VEARRFRSFSFCRGGRRDVAGPGVGKVLGAVAPRRPAVYLDLLRGDVVVVQQAGQAAGVERLAFEVGPRCGVRARSRVRMSSVVMARAPPKMSRRSASRRIPRLMPRSALSQTSQEHASRPRSDQGPPAASATASRGSDTSAGRSVTRPRRARGPHPRGRAVRPDPSRRHPKSSYGRRNRQAIAARETRVATRLRAVEHAYRTATEHDTAPKRKEPTGMLRSPELQPDRQIDLEAEP